MTAGMKLEGSIQLVDNYANGTLLAGRVDSVGVILFNQPSEHNAISIEMWVGIGEALDRFAADNDVRVVLYAGVGGKAFTSGADISQFAARRGNAEANTGYARTTDQGRLKLASFAKPSVACVQGYCFGGGLVIAMQADLRVASADALFGIPAARMGIAYGLAPTERLVSLVGPARARLMLYTARRFNAQEALAMGLVEVVVPAEEVVRESLALARGIAENAPLSVQAAKFTIAQVLKAGSERDLAAVEELARRCMDSADYREGRAAFSEKRKPVFTGA